MNLNRPVALITFCFLSFAVTAQFFTPKNYPQKLFYLAGDC